MSGASGSVRPAGPTRTKPQMGFTQHIATSPLTRSREEPQATSTRNQGAVVANPSLPDQPPSDDVVHQEGNVIHSTVSLGPYTTAHHSSEISVPDPTNSSTRVTVIPTQLGASEGLRTYPGATGGTMETAPELMFWNQSVNRPSNDNQSFLSNTDRIESPAQQQWPTPPASNSGGGRPGQSPGSHNGNSSMHSQQSDPLGNGLLNFLPSIASRLKTVNNGMYIASTVNLEVGRLSLLQDACLAGDVFYLSVHQIFCLATSCPAQQTERFRFNKFHLQGFSKLAELILPNTNLQLNAARWFSKFPDPLDALLERSPTYRIAFQEACSCIEQLGRNWDQFKRSCLIQRSPPLVDNIEIHLSVKSKVLQHVIFTAILRVSWIGYHDECFQNCDKAFLGNQEVSHRWSLQQNSNNPPSEEEVKAYYQDLIAQYQRIQIEHMQHTRQENQVHVSAFQTQSPSTAPVMGPPQHNQNGHPLGNLQHPTVLTPNTPQPRRQSIDENPSLNLPVSNGRINEQTPLENNQTWPTAPTLPSSNQIPSGSLFSTDGGIVSANGVEYHPGDQPQLYSTNPSVAHPIAVQRTPIVPSSGSSTPFRSPVHSSFTINTGRAHSHSSSAQSSATPLQMRIIPGVNSPGFPDRPNSVASQPTGLRTPRGTHFPVPPPTSLFLPPVGYSMPHVAQPELYNLAMHQAHIRDPEMVVVDSPAEVATEKAYYQYLKELIWPLLLIKPTTRVVHSSFFVSAAKLPLIPKDVPQPRGAPSQRRVRVGSCMFRLRCIALQDQTELSSCRWAVEETTWPNNVTITLNGINLEIRRKSHYGKDQPIDLTPHVKERDNKISLAVLRIGQAVLTKSTYAVAIEVIHVGNLNSVMSLVRRSEANKVQELIGKQASNKDPEIEVMGSSVAVSVVDPFSMSLIKLPARGEGCRHYECFDLLLFLQTRQGSPCKPEQFRCPICNSDARPDALIIDTWFEKVLESIREMGRTDARTVVVDSTGDWKIQEERAKGESGDGTGLRRREEDDADPERSTSEVIVID